MSTIGDVKNKIKDHLTAMDDGAGTARFHSVSTIPILDEYAEAPYAEIFFGSGEFFSDVNGSLDYPLTMVIRITIDDEDVATTIWEELVKLWFDETLFQELSDVGVLRCHPLDGIAPVVLPGGERYIMDIKYLLELRYSY